MSRVGGLSSSLAAARLAGSGGGGGSKSVSLQTNPDDHEDFQPRDMQFTLLPLAHSSKSGNTQRTDHTTQGKEMTRTPFARCGSAVCGSL